MLGALILAVLLAALDTSIVVTALPTIAGEFGQFERLAWITTAYIVTATMGIPVLGKLSDLYGRRRVFQTAMAVFAVSSLLCGLAQSMVQLIAARALQGLGGGAIQALAFAILGDIISARDRGRYIGYFTVAFAGAAFLGPLLGGLIIDNWSWPWIFYINVPLCLITMAITHRALKLPFSKRGSPIDWTGAALLVAGIGALMIGLEQGRSGIFNVRTGVLVAIAAAIGVMFVRVERRAADPILPPRMFTNRVLLSSAMLGFCAGGVSFGAVAFMSVYFQDALFVSPTSAGFRTLPMMITITISSTVAGRLIAKTGRYRMFPIVGAALAALGSLGLSRITGATPYVLLIAPLACLGLGSGMVFTTTSIATQNACDLRDMGVATATLMFFRNLGGSIVAALSGTILNSTIRTDVPKRVDITASAAVDLVRKPSEIQALPAGTRSAVIDAVATGVGRVFLLGAVLYAIGVYWAWTTPELPLRRVASVSQTMAAEAG